MFLHYLAATQAGTLSFAPRAARCTAWHRIRPVGNAERQGGSRETGYVSKSQGSHCMENASLPVLAA